MIVIGYQSALEYWRCAGPDHLGSARHRRAATAKALRVLASHEKPQLSNGDRRPAGCQLPLHVLVGTPEARTRTSKITAHVHVSERASASTPVSSFVAAGEGFLIASPELCFLQLASTMSIEQLIQLGYELCGTYSLREGYSAVNRADALTSNAKLASFARRSAFARGRKKALRAIRYIRDGAASPMETNLAMLLSLPYALGGYGIDAPDLNYRVDVPQSMRNRADRSYCLCDLCWPEAKLCVEYDSARYHLQPEQQESDARRRNTLVALGFTVITVSPRQLMDSGMFNRVARQVASCLRKRMRYIDPGFTRKHIALRKLLFDK